MPSDLKPDEIEYIPLEADVFAKDLIQIEQDASLSLIGKQYKNGVLNTQVLIAILRKIKC